MSTSTSTGDGEHVHAPHLDPIFEAHPGQKPGYLSPALIIVMGTSGCGKSTVGADLAKSFRIQFVDGDSLHPQSNIDKMSNGHPLDDEDRFPWLDIIRKEAAQKTTRDALRAFYDGHNLKDPDQPRAAIVIACSALKKSYRDILRGSSRIDSELDESHKNLQTYFVYLKGSRATLRERMTKRKNHFFTDKMLDSQLATLEEPSKEEEKTEGVFEVSIEGDREDVSRRAVEAVAKGVGLKALEQPK